MSLLYFSLTDTLRMLPCKGSLASTKALLSSIHFCLAKPSSLLNPSMTVHRLAELCWLLFHAPFQASTLLFVAGTSSITSWYLFHRAYANRGRPRLPFLRFLPMSRHCIDKLGILVFFDTSPGSSFAGFSSEFKALVVMALSFGIYPSVYVVLWINYLLF